MDSARAAVRPLTPNRDSRATGNVGRCGRLELTFAVCNGSTVLAHSYAEPPFRAGRTFPAAAGCHFILASSAPGIFGGDSFDQTVIVQAGADVRLTSQSALQAHPTPDGSVATLTSAFRVERHARLHCEWDPVIPFPDARLDQRIQIELEEGASLFWSDAVMSGREARGERWRFARLAHQLRCSRAGALVYLERYDLDTSEDRFSHRWIAGDNCYFGTLLIVAPQVDRALAEEMHRDINGIEQVRGAADVIEDGVLLVRLMSASGVAFHAVRRRLSHYRSF